MSNWTEYPQSNRPAAVGVNGMVASAHPLASMSGLDILKEGGNAFDAVVATASTLNVVEPYMSGVGGIGVAIANVAKENRVRALDFSGRMPNAAEPSIFTDETKAGGILASLIPGNLAGWLALHEEYGSLDRDRLFARAINYAENGFPITHINSLLMSQYVHLLQGFPTSKEIILGGSNKSPLPGSRLKMQQLAESFKIISAGGVDAFYRGDLTSRIVKGNNDYGGIFTEEDFASYRPEWRDPISMDYRGFRVHTTPPNCSSFQVLQTLKLMENLDDLPMKFQDPMGLHFLIEAIKLAAADRINYAGDPDYASAPINALLSQSYAEQQAKRVGRVAVLGPIAGEHYAKDRIEGVLKPGSPEEFDGGMTTHFSVADRDGNVVTVTQTLGGGFGSGAAVGDTGIFLNNMAEYFDLDEGSPNQIGPGKRVDFVVAPIQVFKGDKFYLSIGTPGSYGILQTTPQLIMNVLDLEMTVQQSVEAPRLKVIRGRNVQMEERFPPNVRKFLEGLSHEIETLGAWSMGVGGAQGIVADQDNGTFQGGADPRRDGFALGW
ncbi:MAG: gamma-glutamyltransferase [SAR202 cluster bacterium]|nr:gamma-glutamyltransferase [SAR202 cluster bacterium]